MKLRMTPKPSTPTVDFKRKPVAAFGAVKAGVCTMLLASSSLGYALDFGPDGMFSLTGFAEGTTTAQSNYCLNCQVANKNTSKQLQAADAIIPGKSYSFATLTNWQVQPYLGAKRRLGQGYEVSATLSQRYRQGTVNGNLEETRYAAFVDVPDYWYEKNVALSHEDMGSVRVGAMTTRGWSVADYPYGGNLGLAEAWGASGAGYGMLANAIRLGSRPLDVAEGNLFLELTYDRGNTNFKRLRPSFFELYGQYSKGDLVLDTVVQHATNGSAGAWGHAPFSSVTPFVDDDSYVGTDGSKFGETHQSIVMAMARYQVNAKVEVSGGIRHNHWSGANVVFNPATKWTSGFNVDYSNPFATSHPGYSASSIDAMLGARYRDGPWTYLVGMVYLGAAETRNPSDRGQGNSAIFGTLGARYALARGLELSGTAAMVHYGKQGLSPMSMPGNASFSNVDSRVTRDGYWITLGMLYSF